MMREPCYLPLEIPSILNEAGIGQVFIAVFDVLLTLLDSSATGIPHAYADDLIHMSPFQRACLFLFRSSTFFWRI